MSKIKTPPQIPAPFFLGLYPQFSPSRMVQFWSLFLEKKHCLKQHAAGAVNDPFGHRGNPETRHSIHRTHF